MVMYIYRWVKEFAIKSDRVGLRSYLISIDQLRTVLVERVKKKSGECDRKREMSLQVENFLLYALSHTVVFV